MLIKGQLSEYECKFKRVGYSYADIIVYETKENTVRFFFGLFSDTRVRKVKVWETDLPELHGALLYDRLNKMHPKELRRLFTAAVVEYEAYAAAWAKEFDTINVTVTEHASIISTVGQLR